MSSFKEQIQSDIQQTFLNENEFADWHSIDDQSMKAVIVDDINDNRDNKHPLAHAEGVVLVRKTIHVALADIGYVPVQEQRIVVDDQLYYVSSAGVADGMVVIVIEANQG